MNSSDNEVSSPSPWEPVSVAIEVYIPLRLGQRFVVTRRGKENIRMWVDAVGIDSVEG